MKAHGIDLELLEVQKDISGIEEIGVIKVTECRINGEPVLLPSDTSPITIENVGLNYGDTWDEPVIVTIRMFARSIRIGAYEENEDTEYTLSWRSRLRVAWNLLRHG